MRGLMDGALDTKRAGLMLYALQTAAYNVKNTAIYRRDLERADEELDNPNPTLVAMVVREKARLDQLQEELEAREAALAVREQNLFNEDPVPDALETAGAAPLSQSDRVRTNDPDPTTLTLHAAANLAPSPSPAGPITLTTTLTSRLSFRVSRRHCARRGIAIVAIANGAAAMGRSLDPSSQTEPIPSSYCLLSRSASGYTPSTFTNSATSPRCRSAFSAACSLPRRKST